MNAPTSPLQGLSDQLRDFARASARDGFSDAADRYDAWAAVVDSLSRPPVGMDAAIEELEYAVLAKSRGLDPYNRRLPAAKQAIRELAGRVAATSAPSEPKKIEVDATAAIHAGFKHHGYQQGTPQCVAFYRGACWNAATSPAATSAKGDVATLGEAIAKAAQKAGIYNGEVPLTGPHLLQLLDDLASAATPAATDAPTEAAPALTERDVLQLVIQRLNGSPYNLTKSECISEVVDMRNDLCKGV